MPCRKWPWHLFLPFSVSLKQAGERDIAIERSLQDLLNPRDAASDSHELAFRTAEQVAQRLLEPIVVAWRAHAGEEFAQQGIAGDEVPLNT